MTGEGEGTLHNVHMLWRIGNSKPIFCWPKDATSTAKEFRSRTLSTKVNQLHRMKKCSSCKKFSVLDPLSMKPNTAAFITLFDKISKIRQA